jgi:hypothetical protein
MARLDGGNFGAATLTGQPWKDSELSNFIADSTRMHHGAQARLQD